MGRDLLINGYSPFNYVSRHNYNIGHYNNDIFTYEELVKKLKELVSQLEQNPNDIYSITEAIQVFAKAIEKAYNYDDSDMKDFFVEGLPYDEKWVFTCQDLEKEYDEQLKHNTYLQYCVKENKDYFLELVKRKEELNKEYDDFVNEYKDKSIVRIDYS